MHRSDTVFRKRPWSFHTGLLECSFSGCFLSNSGSHTVKIPSHMERSHVGRCFCGQAQPHLSFRHPVQVPGLCVRKPLGDSNPSHPCHPGHYVPEKGQPHFALLNSYLMESMSVIQYLLFYATKFGSGLLHSNK